MSNRDRPKTADQGNSTVFAQPADRLARTRRRKDLKMRALSTALALMALAAGFPTSSSADDADAEACRNFADLQTYYAHEAASAGEAAYATSVLDPVSPLNIGPMDSKYPVQRSCGFSGPMWSENYEDNYQRCLNG